MLSAVYPEYSRKGFTLIELLVVVSIISILTVVGMTNFSHFSGSQVTVKASGVVQTVLRLAQSNASSSTLCNGQSGVVWAVILNSGNLGLSCGPTGSPLQLQNTYGLENAQISSVTCSDNTAVSLPVTVSFASLSGNASFPCAADTSSLSLIISNSINPSSQTKTVTVSKGGGTINVQ